MSDPNESYREIVRRLAERQRTVKQQDSLHLLYSRTRVGTFVGLVVLAWFVLHDQILSAWWLSIPTGIFVALLAFHDRLLRQRERSRRGVAVYEQALRRMEDRWIGTGNRGERFVSAAHPYSGDLDIFGRGSLFELLCTARTMMGESTLASWLTAPAEPAAIQARQTAVRDLQKRLDFREALATSGEEVRSMLKPQVLADWSAISPKPIEQAAWLLAWTMVACNLGAALYGFMGHGYYLLAALIAGNGVLLSNQRKRIRSAALTTARPAGQLELMEKLLSQIEQETFDAPILRAMQAELGAGDQSASHRIRRLQTLLLWMELRNNIFFKFVDVVVLWTVQFAFAIENWRAANGGQLLVWTRVIGEFEALTSLATYAYEHPADPFPEIAETGVFLQAEGVSHPLLPDKKAIRNDVQLNASQRLYIISGSNMSGKSTLLRTLGVNMVLALAGAPVRARRLALSPLHLGASLRTQDSLQGGISRFYAEIQRLRQIVDISKEQPPLLFLLDEVLHGTNSHDRRVGAEAVLRSLLREGALGLLTTHDLTLTQIASDPDLHAVNAHFEDEIVEGKMHFDYHLRPGVVTRSNAIELMRAVGLEV